MNQKKKNVNYSNADHRPHNNLIRSDQTDSEYCFVFGYFAIEQEEKQKKKLN